MAREPLKATFFAFRRRERRGVLWAAFFVHFFNAVSLLVILIGSAAFYGRGLVGGQTLLSRFGAAPLIAELMILLLFYQINSASFDGACLRWFLRGERKGFLGSSFDRDAWRIVLGQWLWAVLTFGCLVVVGIIASVVAAFVHTGLTSEALVVSIVYPLSGIAILLLIVRMGPANALGLAKHRFSFFEAWEVSKSRFWSLLGSWLIVLMIWLVTYVVLYVALAFGAYAALGGGEQGGAAAVLALVAALLVTRLLLTPLIAGVNARAVLAAAEEGRIEGLRLGASVASVFE